MTNLINISQGVILPLIQPLDDVYNGLLASKHKKTTRNTYRLNLKHFAYYLLSNEMVKGKKIKLPEEKDNQVFSEFSSFESKLANAYEEQQK